MHLLLTIKFVSNLNDWSDLATPPSAELRNEQGYWKWSSTPLYALDQLLRPNLINKVI